jgi:hypothetical protein
LNGAARGALSLLWVDRAMQNRYFFKFVCKLETLATARQGV